MQCSIPILSLTVALLAVFVGPWVSWIMTKRQLESAQRLANSQLESSRRVANKQIIAPMRQAWINELRKKIAELSSSALHYFVTGYEQRKDEECKRLTELEQEIILTVNPRENEHLFLLTTIREMISALERGRQHDDEFIDAQKKMMELAQIILKTEWNRVREEV